MSKDKNYSTISTSKLKTNESLEHKKNAITETTNNDSLIYSKILTKRDNIRNPISLRNNDVLLTSIFQLPLINKNKKNPSLKTERRYEKNDSNDNSENRQSLFKDYNNFKSNQIKKQEKEKDNPNQTDLDIIKPNRRKHKKDKISLKIETQLKDKFYIDVENKILLHLKDKKLIQDETLNNRMIHMKKISSFWKSVADYINPILQIEKFKLKKLNNGQLIDFENNNKKHLKHIPKIYTSVILSDKLHKQKIQKEKLYLEKLIETQKSYDFY